MSVSCVECADLIQYRDNLDYFARICNIGEMKKIIIDINKYSYEDKYYELWRKYYLSRAHSLLSDSYYKGKTEEIAYNHARNAADALNGLERQASADAEIYALLGGVLGRVAAGAADAVSKANLGMRSDRAIARALECDPGNPRALLMHGRSLLLKPRLFGGNKKRALAVLGEARERALDARRPDGPEPAWGLEEACFWLSYGLLHFNRYDEARAALAPLRDLEPVYYLLKPMQDRIDEKERLARSV
ncbi:MAG: hypothetical protein Tsb008_06880 [Rhodothalassiaceae bacterium]